MFEKTFFVRSPALSLAKIAELTGCEISDSVDLNQEIDDVGSLSDAKAGSVVFIEHKKYIPALAACAARHVFCRDKLVDDLPSDFAALVTPFPAASFHKISAVFYPTSLVPRYFKDVVLEEGGYSSHPSVQFEDDVHICAGAVIGAHVEIGQGSYIGPNTTIADGCKIGRDCHIGANVSLMCCYIGDNVTIHSGAAIGQDGFGFTAGPQGLVKAPQLGRVIIQNHVEIGANSAIDRGALTDTVIGEGTKIDNFVQIAHNVKIGRMCLIAGHSGISGSCEIGDFTMLGGRVGLADHIKIGRNVQIAAASGVMTDIPDGARYSGIPAKPALQHFREVATLTALTKKRGKSDGK